MASGSGWEGLEENHPKTQVTQEPEITEEPQLGFGYKTVDGSHKDFPEK
jgi:hypothetical protein